MVEGLTATWPVCLNIAYTLMVVPAFYRRVLSVMKDLNLPPPFESAPQADLFFPWFDRLPQRSAQITYEFVTRRVEELGEIEEIGDAGSEILADLVNYFRQKAEKERRKNKELVSQEEEEKLLIKVAGNSGFPVQKEDLDRENDKAKTREIDRKKRICTIKDSFWREEAEEMELFSEKIEADTQYEEYTALQEPLETPFPSQAELLTMKVEGRIDFRTGPRAASEV